ncbi:uncharacterized protein LOC143180119 [Calliopsis andreniformis]|uniref:uncharacterized protein LOC143180119 n=1 Tax=Calliopsis andreniformis TaxID=337506 RepID=UPI003FCD5350
MSAKEQLSFELQGIFDEFTRVRDAYVAMKAYCDAQEETLALEKERSKRMKGNIEKLSTTYLLLEKRYKSTLEELKTEKENLCKTVEDLKEQCDHLRLIGIDRNGNDEQICKLQDEIEVLKVQMQLQEEKHNEDVAILKQRHSDEIKRYKVLLQNSKQDVATNQSRKRGPPKNVDKNKKNTFFFRWPELDIQKVSNTLPLSDEEEIENNKNNGNKRRKLFQEDRDAVFNIV